MSVTKYFDGCTCTHRKCHRYHAPELLCRPALAESIVDHLDAKGEAKEKGDEAKVKREEEAIAYLKKALKERK